MYHHLLQRAIKNSHLKLNFFAVPAIILVLSVSFLFDSSWGSQVKVQAQSALAISSIAPTSGSSAGGYTVTLNGSGFLNGGFDNAGSIDTNFDVGTGLNNTPYAISIQSDDKIIIGGSFTSYNGATAKLIARINTDGSLDTSFSGDNAIYSSTVFSTAIQSDGKIIIAGNFPAYRGVETNRIARLNTNGSLDTSFDIGAGANDTIKNVLIQDDGKIVIVGDFTSYNGISRNGLARLNTNGSLDTSFVVGTAANGLIRSVATQSDGKVIIGGSFSNYNGTSVNRIARLNTNGSLDTSFVTGTGTNNSVYTVATQSDGKVIIGGSFSNYNGTSVNRIARLNTNGSLDTSFNGVTEATNSIDSVIIQSDGKIVLNEYWGFLNGLPNNRIVRLETNGSLDTSFNSGYGSYNSIHSIAIQGDNSVIIGGDFTSYSGTARNRIARLGASVSTSNIVLASVTISGQTCTDLVVISDTEATCTAPAVSEFGLTEVVLTRSDNQTITLANGFAYTSSNTDSTSTGNVTIEITPDVLSLSR